MLLVRLLLHSASLILRTQAKGLAWNAGSTITGMQGRVSEGWRCTEGVKWRKKGFLPDKLSGDTASDREEGSTVALPSKTARARKNLGLIKALS